MSKRTNGFLALTLALTFFNAENAIAQSRSNSEYLSVINLKARTLCEPQNRPDRNDHGPSVLGADIRLRPTASERAAPPEPPAAIALLHQAMGRERGGRGSRWDVELA